jgi:hypothetical protein
MCGCATHGVLALPGTQLLRDNCLLGITAPGCVDTNWAQVGCCSAVGNCKGFLVFRWKKGCVWPV